MRGRTPLPPLAISLVTALVLTASLGVAIAGTPCMLANPSFELPGDGGSVFAGWNTFGIVDSTPAAPHGAVAARLTSPDTGPWGVSACWQRLETAPGASWRASTSVAHDVDRPLLGESRAILNVEWRDAAGALIAYESHTLADAATPPGEHRRIEVESGPAPPQTVATHLLLGVIQGPDDPVAEVRLDEVTFEDLGPPTPEERQWLDFPGERTLSFDDRLWRVKGPGVYGPGPNTFCDTVECTWVDADGRLHLTIEPDGLSFTCTELALVEPLGYGDYVFTTRGRLDTWHPDVVLGLFLWRYGACYDPADGWWNPYDEIDIEFGRWGDVTNDVAQFVVQPYDAPGNLVRFDPVYAEGEVTSHAFRWRADRVEFRSWRGGPHDEATSAPIHAWGYEGPHLPRPAERPRVHVNFWLVGGRPPGGPHEVVIEHFTFVPEGGTPVDVPSPPVPVVADRLSVALPNPFSPATTIRFHTAGGDRVTLQIYDVAGRLVRTLADGVVGGGRRALTWDGRDARGRSVAPGVYLYRLDVGSRTHVQRVVRAR